MSKSGGRKEKREAKLKDITQDASGNVIYTGDLYCVADDAITGSGRRQKAMLRAGLIALMLTVIGSGCIDADSASGTFWLVLPYIGEVSALFALAWCMIRLIHPSDGVREYVLEQNRSKVPAACRMLSAFAAAELVLSAIYLARNGAGDTLLNSIAYLMLKAAATALAEWYRRLFISIKWEKIDI